MNLERLINMVVNQFIRRLIDMVLDRGFGFAKRQMVAKEDMTPEELRQRETMEKLTSRPNEIKEIGRSQF